MLGRKTRLSSKKTQGVNEWAAGAVYQGKEMNTMKRFKSDARTMNTKTTVAQFKAGDAVIVGGAHAVVVHELPAVVGKPRAYRVRVLNSCGPDTLESAVEWWIQACASNASIDSNAATDTLPAPAPEFDAAGENLTDAVMAYIEREAAKPIMPCLAFDPAAPTPPRRHTMLPPPALCACAVRGCPYSTKRGSRFCPGHWGTLQRLAFSTVRGVS